MFTKGYVSRGMITLSASGGITSVAATEDRRFVIGTASGNVQLWNALDAENMSTEADDGSSTDFVTLISDNLAHHTLGVRCVRAGGENKDIGVCTSLDGELTVFRISETETLSETQVQGRPGESMAAAVCSKADVAIAVGTHGSVRVLDAANGVVNGCAELEKSTGAPALANRAEIPKDKRNLLPIALSVDIDITDAHALVGVDDGSLAFIDMQTAKVLWTQRGCHRHAVKCVAFAKHTPSEIVTSGSDQLISVFDVRARQVAATVRGHTGPVTCASFSHSGTYFATGATDRSVRIWDRRKMEMTFRSRTHQQTIMDLDYLKDGIGIVSVAEDSTLIVHDATDTD